MNACADSLTSLCENVPTPIVKRSISSRAKFSFGELFTSVSASSQISIAGSFAMASVSSSYDPVPRVRKSSFW